MRPRTSLASFAALAPLAMVMLGNAPHARAEALSPSLNPAAGVVNLSSSASLELTQDWISVTLSTQRDGTEAQAVQTKLKLALDAALQEAKRSALPGGGLEVQTGGFSIAPRFDAKGNPNGWQGSASLVIEGRDMAAVAQLTGRINSLSIAQVRYALSREARERVESSVTQQALIRFQQRAAEVSKQLGFAGYAIKELQLQSDEPMPEAVPMLRARAVAMAAPSNEALPVEAGKATVKVTVSGSVLLQK